jgi:hypothetical protein
MSFIIFLAGCMLVSGDWLYTGLCFIVAAVVYWIYRYQLSLRWLALPVVIGMAWELLNRLR